MTLTTAVYADEDNVDISDLSRSMRDIVKYLESKRKNARTSYDLFTNSIEGNRSRLLVVAEKLMFAAPKEYGRKCEDIIWKKGFYEAYGYIKQLKTEVMWTKNEIYYLQNIFNSGVGFYHNLLMRIQEDFQVDLSNILDVPIFSIYGLEKYEYNESDLSVRNKLRPANPNRLVDDSVDWISDAVYRCLIYIGDLNRYMLDLYPGWNLSISSGYYWRAVFWKPNMGLAFNQLATLSNSQNNIIDAVYYYMRCLCSSNPFEAAEANLVPILNQNIASVPSSIESVPGEKAVRSKFFNLIGIWFIRRNTEGVQELCIDVLDNLTVFYKRKTHATDDSFIQSMSLEEITFNKRTHSIDQIYSDTVFKILIICCMCYFKLSHNDSDIMNSPVTLITALIYHMLERIVIHMKVSLSELKVPSKKRTGLKRFKRRCRRRRDSLSGNDISDNSDIDGCLTDSEESEEELIFDEISDDDEDEIVQLKEKLLNGYANGHGVNGLSISDTQENLNSLMRLLEENRYILQAMKIAFDWMECNLNVLSALESWTPFMENLVLFLNYISGAIVLRYKRGKVIDIVSDEERTQPLAEDWHLKGFLPLQSIHQTLNWDYDVNNHTCLQQMRIRIKRFVDFGIVLAKRPKSKLIYDADRYWFTWMPNFCQKKQQINDGISTGNNKNDNNRIVERGKLSSEIRQFWLEEDMKRSEREMKRKSEPHFIVMDGEAFIRHHILIKKIAVSKQFMLIVPSPVISTLDAAKGDNTNARESVRWLEGQFRMGNPYVRAQRTFESKAIPVTTYPKKRDKHSWTYVKILECCYFLNYNAVDLKANDVTYQDDEVNLVRFLTGSRDVSAAVNSIVQETKNGSFDFAFAAKATGVVVEHVVDFYEKWKNSKKNRFNR